jgi:tRNA pseudouridine55 synthase
VDRPRIAAKVTAPTRSKRDIDGILLLDKPPGYTSNRVLQEVKRLLRARKAGHTGSLDPLATGLLPLCFGEATKVSQFLLESDKRYWTAVRLGISTNTYDADGEVVATRPVTVDRGAVEAALDRFRGEIAQVAPAFSAIKQAGQPLYKLARAGLDVAPPVRQVVVHDIVLRAWHGDHLELEVACSKGTYIRSLAHDLGEVLGCGAHVTALRRLGMGGFHVDQAVSLETFRGLDEGRQWALLIPADHALGHLPAINLTESAAFYLCQGQVVTARHDHGPGIVRLYDGRGRFLGLGEVLVDRRVAPKRLVNPAERSDIAQESG